MGLAENQGSEILYGHHNARLAWLLNEMHLNKKNKRQKEKKKEKLVWVRYKQRGPAAFRIVYGENAAS